MSEILAAVRRERRAEREKYLGPHSLSVLSMHVERYSPEGMEIIAIGSSNPYRIDERGMVHFPEPVGALVREKERRHVVRISVPEIGLNGNSFLPFITEKDSRLYAQFRAYMQELVQDSNWRIRPLPGKGLDVRLTEAEESAWERWMRIEMGRKPESDKHWREQGL